MGANLANVVQVREVMTTTLTDAEIQAHIDMAHRYLEDALGSASLTEVQKADIEVYASAHLISSGKAASSPTAGSAEEIQVGESRTRFTANALTGEGLKASRFGRIAIMLDTSGTLASSGKKPALFRVVAS